MPLTEVEQAWAEASRTAQRIVLTPREAFGEGHRGLRPATGIGAPAVPSRTSSVAMRARSIK